MKKGKNTIYAKYIKRLLDICCSLCALIVLSPVLLVTALLVHINLGSPVIFRQERPGKNEKIFTLYKFRTMTNKRDQFGVLLSDDIRLTKFGRFLRSTSLDELPELWNILKGDMSIVGPRPLLVKDMVFMTAEQRRRHEVRQGLTGLAQINGRNGLSWEKKLEYDLQYTNQLSFMNDIFIIFHTMSIVAKRDGISQNNMETAEDLGDYLLHNKKIDYVVYDELQRDAIQILNS